MKISDQEAYERAKGVLHDVHINDRNPDGSSKLKFFGYDFNDDPIFAVLPEDIPSCRYCRTSEGG